MRKSFLFIFIEIFILTILCGCNDYASIEESSFTSAPESSLADAETNPVNTEPSNSVEKKCLSVYYINQYPDYPTGCEGCSAVMALANVGVVMDADLFFEKYLPTAEFPFDPYTCFGGNPRDNTGFGCFAPALCNAMNKALQYVPYQAETIYGKPLEKLCEEYIDNDIPVIIWASIDMAELHVNSFWTINGRFILWKSPEHCLVLIGYDDSHYYFNDPTKGKNVRYSKESVAKAYKQMGRQAVVIKKTSSLS